MADAFKAQKATGVARVSRNVQRCSRLHVVASTVSGPPPAWNKRVVVPEVQPRDSPKVITEHCRTCSRASVDQMRVVRVAPLAISLQGNPQSIAAHMDSVFQSHICYGLLQCF